MVNRNILKLGREVEIVNESLGFVSEIREIKFNSYNLISNDYCWLG